MKRGIRRASLGIVITLAWAAVSPLAPAAVSAGASAGQGPCAWGFVMSSAKNVIWPETNAVFWTTPFVLFPWSELVVRGTYPEARYMSVKTYGGAEIVESLSDQQIAPDAGSVNPFTDPEAPEDPALRRYTVRVRPRTAVAGGDNVLAAFPNSAALGLVFLNYRVYVPDDPGNVTGGELPRVSVRLLGGLFERPLPTCPQAVAPERLTAAGIPPVGAAGPAETSGDEVSPVVFRQNSAAHLWPNPDDAYLVGKVAYQPGRVAVVRARGAVFPDTRAGAHVTDPHQLRYWSMCVHMLTLPLPTAGCAGDFETVLDPDGYYTYLVSLPEDRPANADAAHGVTWLPWGRPGVDVALTLRNMLPDPSFPHAIQGVTEPGTEPAVMGDYYPQAGACDRSVVEAGGPTACLPAA